MNRPAFQRYIGVDLGGGKGRNTAVAVLRAREDGGVTVDQYGTADSLREGARPWYDDRLIAFLRDHAGGALLAVDAPLTLTACVRCTVPACPGTRECVDPTVVWFRDRAPLLRREVAPGGKPPVELDEIYRHPPDPDGKPRFTPYTQRATETWLSAVRGITPRETLGQGMGPLTARAAHLVRALAPLYRRGENLLEVYPKATIWKLFGERTARTYKRHHDEQTVRLESILEALPGLDFAPGQWREFGLHNDHLFDALICAYTAFLWARDRWQLPVEDRAVFEADGWIWAPP